MAARVAVAHTLTDRIREAYTAVLGTCAFYPLRHTILQGFTMNFFGTSWWQLTPNQSSVKLCEVAAPVLAASGAVAVLPLDTYEVALNKGRVKGTNAIAHGNQDDELTFVLLNAHRRQNSQRLNQALIALNQLAEVRLQQGASNTGYGCVLGSVLGGCGTGVSQGAAAGPLGAAVGAVCGGVGALVWTILKQHNNITTQRTIEDLLVFFQMYHDTLSGEMDSQTLLDALLVLDRKRASMSQAAQMAFLEMERLLLAHNNVEWYRNLMQDYFLLCNSNALIALYAGRQP